MTIITPLTNICNQHCIYCSSHNRKENSREEIIKSIIAEDNHLIFSGGETTLAKNLFKYLSKAKKKDLFIELQTNGVTSSYFSFAKKLVSSKIDLFNVSFPSFNSETYQKITKTFYYDKCVKGIKNIIGLKGNVRITNVINNLNYKELPDLVRFVKKEFSGLNLLELNFVKGVGLAKNNKEVIPKHKEISKYLVEALRFCLNQEINVIVDHIPLCYLKGFEDLSVDFQKIVNNKDKTFLDEKIKIKKCKDCDIKNFCTGIRKDYYELYKEEVNPVSTIFNIDDISENISKEKDLLKKRFDFFIKYDIPFQLINYPLCIFRSYKKYVKKTKDFKKPNSCNECRYLKECAGIPKKYFEKNGSSEFIAINEKAFLTNREKCILSILNYKNDLTTKEIFSLTSKFNICADCSSSDNSIIVARKLEKKNKLSKKLTKKGYVWSLKK
ncbi:radical SAM protein [Candidatus Woesearchaeota archaeon]|nr:radical SAM protein [Candidatus Woesearchaeota archaeon]